jgi:Fic family protein
MKEFINFANTNVSEEKILEKIAKIHFDFVKIHPFVD